MKFIILIYACFILIGGFFGHLSGSQASLISALVSGSLLLIAFFGMHFKKMWGCYLALVVTFALELFFTVRYLKSFKFMPPGLLSILSLIVLILIIRHTIKLKK